MIKLISIDMDGTLLNDDKEISYENLKSLKMAIENGVHIVIASGRTLKGIPKELIDLGVRFVISSNGGIVYDLNKSEIVSREGIDSAVACKIINDLDTYSSRVYCNYMGEHYFTKNSKKTFKEKFFIVDDNSFFENLGEYLIDNNILPEKIGIVCDSSDVKDEIVLLQSKYPELTIVETSPYSVEMTNLNITKGSALSKIADYLNISSEEVMAIGDSNNDIEMLNYAKVSVAMENATESVKNVCKYFTSSNNDNGVSKAINRFLQGE